MILVWNCHKFSATHSDVYQRAVMFIVVSQKINHIIQYPCKTLGQDSSEGCFPAKLFGKSYLVREKGLCVDDVCSTLSNPKNVVQCFAWVACW